MNIILEYILNKLVSKLELTKHTIDLFRTVNLVFVLKVGALSSQVN